MDEKQTQERKRYLVLQGFYIKVKELIDELEEKLNIEPQKVVKLKRLK